MLLFGFLEANDLTSTFHYFISDGISLLVRIEASNIPIQNLPRLVVYHGKQEQGRAMVGGKRPQPTTTQNIGKTREAVTK